jgi:hypothetical protein
MIREAVLTTWSTDLSSDFLPLYESPKAEILCFRIRVNSDRCLFFVLQRTEIAQDVFAQNSYVKSEFLDNR